MHGVRFGIVAAVVMRAIPPPPISNYASKERCPVYGDRANLYENLWADMKAYARQFAATDAALPADDSLESAFRAFLIGVDAPSLPDNAREFYGRELRELIRDYRGGVLGKNSYPAPGTLDMQQNGENGKIEAIYALRNAAEEKGRAEHALEVAPSTAARDALLDAQIDVENKTVRAIDACHECGHEHGPGQPHGSNLIRVDFSRAQESSEEQQPPK